MSAADDGAGERRVGAPSAGLYDLLANQAQDAILFFRSDDGRIVEANVAAERTYGYAREEFLNLTVLDLLAPEGRLDKSDANEQRLDTLHRRKDGSTFPVEVTTTAVTDGAHLLVSVIRDATARREMEAALRLSEDRLALAVEAAGLGLFYAVPYGPMYWSPRCREIFGVGDAPIPDFESFLKLVHPADRDQVREAAARWLDPAGDGRYKDQYRCQRPDGSVRWVAASGIVRLEEVDGVHVPVQLVGTVYDITDQKLAQEQVMLTDRLASVGMLAAGVAHEINNPLSYLMGALDYLEERLRESGGPGVAFGEVARALEEARDGAHRVRQVVRDLRTFSGTRADRRARVELRPIVEAAVRMAGREVRARARLVPDYLEAPAVVADESRLGQVVLNLLVNAAHAIPEGRARENEVQVAIGTAPDGRARLEVRDTGSGIPAAVAGRIFEPFFTTKPREVGTGLGLAICREIVVGLGGEILAEPRVGGGTTMRVLLPPAPAGTEPAPPREASRGRILVVDAEPAVGLGIRRLLAGEYEVLLRTRAEDALRAIADGERFEAILCDLALPGAGALDFHEAVAALDPRQAGRLIVLIGSAASREARQRLMASALPSCQMPVDLALLRDALERLPS